MRKNLSKRSAIHKKFNPLTWWPKFNKVASNDTNLKHYMYNELTMLINAIETLNKIHISASIMNVESLQEPGEVPKNDDYILPYPVCRNSKPLSKVISQRKMLKNQQSVNYKSRVEICLTALASILAFLYLTDSNP